MSRDSVLAEQRGAVRVLTFNHPERLNAWSNDMEDRYFELLDEADTDPGVRAVVVTGSGRGFCAGAVMSELEAAGEGEADADAYWQRRPRHRPMQLQKPLIGAINGAAVGLGLVEALYCDVRLCVPDAKLATIFSRRGLIAEYGIAWLLLHQIGRSRTLDLLMSGRTVLGTEALALGLVDRVVPTQDLLDAAVAFASDIATHCSPTSIAVIKQQVTKDAERSFLASDSNSVELMLASFERPDVAEGVAAYLAKRAPEFAPFAGGMPS